MVHARLQPSAQVYDCGFVDLTDHAGDVLGDVIVYVGDFGDVDDRVCKFGCRGRRHLHIGGSVTDHEAGSNGLRRLHYGRLKLIL